MEHRPSKRFTVLCALGLSSWLLGACGGRFRTIQDVDDDTSPTSGAGSVAGAGGTPSSGHGGQAGSSTGHAGSGAAGACSMVKCATNIACPSGSKPVTAPGTCCPMCQPICQQACPASACLPGTHPETPAGACCPVCVDDPGAACMKGQQAYAEGRNNMLMKYEFGCASDAECVVLAPINACEQGCDYAAVWYGAADSFSNNLANLADQTCSGCTLGPLPPCAAPPKPLCVANQCSFDPHAF